MRQFAIADLHGNLATFQALLKSIEYTKQDELFLLGDFIDKGPNSKGVIDFIMGMQVGDHRVHCLRGNHEQMCLDSTRSRKRFDRWMRYGGKPTLKSFGSFRKVPARYVEWMEALPLYLEVPGYLFVHAGLDTELEDPLSDRRSLLWARGWEYDLDREWLGDRIVIHGHTPTDRPLIENAARNARTNQVVCIDSGACSPSAQSGLCAFELGTHWVYFQDLIRKDAPGFSFSVLKDSMKRALGLW